VLGHCSVCFKGVCMPQYFRTLGYLALNRVGLSVLLWMKCCTKCYGLANNIIFAIIIARCLQLCCSASNLAVDRSAVSLFVNLHVADYGLRVCCKTFKLKINKLRWQVVSCLRFFGFTTTTFTQATDIYKGYPDNSVAHNWQSSQLCFKDLLW